MDVPSPVLPASDQAGGRCVRRRLQAKSSPGWDPRLAGIVSPVGVWSKFEESAFAQLDSRQQYKKVYYHFRTCIASNPQVQIADDASCSRELLQLAVKDLHVLNKKQKQHLVVFSWNILVLQSQF